LDIANWLGSTFFELRKNNGRNLRLASPVV
jgi:hypothetical protein